MDAENAKKGTQRAQRTAEKAEEFFICVFTISSGYSLFSKNNFTLAKTPSTQRDNDIFLTTHYFSMKKLVFLGERHNYLDLPT